MLSLHCCQKDCQKKKGVKRRYFRSVSVGLQCRTELKLMAIMQSIGNKTYNSAAFPISNDAAPPSRSPSPGSDSSKHLPGQNLLAHTTALQKKIKATAHASKFKHTDLPRTRNTTLQHFTSQTMLHRQVGRLRQGRTGRNTCLARVRCPRPQHCKSKSLQ